MWGVVLVRREAWPGICRGEVFAILSYYFGSADKSKVHLAQELLMEERKK